VFNIKEWFDDLVAEGIDKEEAWKAAKEEAERRRVAKNEPNKRRNMDEDSIVDLARKNDQNTDTQF